MEVVHGTASLARRLNQPVCAIGNFDGVHVGHQRLFATARERATARDGESVVMTFDPHPAKVLAPELAPPLIYPAGRKLELIAACGIDVCVVEPFTHELASQEARRFVDEVLVRGVGATEIV